MDAALEEGVVPCRFSNLETCEALAHTIFGSKEVIATHSKINLVVTVLGRARSLGTLLANLITNSRSRKNACNIASFRVIAGDGYTKFDKDEEVMIKGATVLYITTSKDEDEDKVLNVLREHGAEKIVVSRQRLG